MNRKVYALAFTTLLLLSSACSVAPVTATLEASKPLAPPAKELQSRARGFACVEGITVVPLRSPGAPRETAFLTLDEALALGVCTVHEGGGVGGLLVSNSGKRPVFCMAGDLLVGGNQDRVLRESLIIRPGASEVAAQVFCVEHGRWSPQAKDGPEAARGYFMNVERTGHVDLLVKRAAIADLNQSAVWYSVEQNINALKITAKPPTGSYRATCEDETINQRIESSMNLTRQLVDLETTGFAVFVRRKLVAYDVFESSALCRKLAEKLLRSYIVTGMCGGYASRPGPDEGDDGDLQDTEESRPDFRRHHAPTSPVPPIELSVEERLDQAEVNFSRGEVTLPEISNALRQQTGVAVSLASEVDMRSRRCVNLRFMTLRQALNSICESSELNWHLEGNVIVLTLKAELRKHQNQEPAPAMEKGALPENPNRRTASLQDSTPGETEEPADDANKPGSRYNREFTPGGITIECIEMGSDRVVQRSFLKR